MIDITSDERNKIEDGALYLVATPIGNLDDISYRALKILSQASFIAAEDTRVTLKLLSRYEISKECVSYHEHNKVQSGEAIITRLKGGESCALVTDAGTPGISDPGADLVASCHKEGIKVVPIPGACAMVCALIMSGMDTRSFAFFGFLDSSSAKARDAQLERIASCGMTAIVYEAPHRLCETLEILKKALGNREVALCRELTKLNEEVKRTTLEEAAAFYSEEENRPRGEYVLVIAPPKNDEAFWQNMDIKEHFEYYTEKLGMDKKAATKQVAQDRGVPKNEIYKALL